MKQPKIKAYFLRVDENGNKYRGYFADIENSLKAKQMYVNYNKPHGLIQVISFGEIDVICNDEGKLLGYPANRVFLGENDELLDFFAGNILCVRHEGEEFVSIRESDKELIEKHLVPIIGILGNSFLLEAEDNLPEWKED